MKTFQLSLLDQQILQELSANARLPLTDLAKRLNIPTSTCHARVRSLEKHGVIQGYTTQVNPEAVGSSLNALILLNALPDKREEIPRLAQELRMIPGVQQVFLIGGDRDFIVHVACPSVAALRDLLANHIGANPDFAQSQTQLVFDALRGLNPLATPTSENIKEKSQAAADSHLGLT